MSEHSTTSGGDVVDLLLDQHRRLRELCTEITQATPAARREPFEQLLRLMAVHEAVEEEIVHPYVRLRMKGSTTMINERLQEENAAKKTLLALDTLGTDAPGFMALFEQFQRSLLEHAAKEESGEFAGIRAQAKPAERAAMVAAVKLAAALAPTHPHPGLETAPRNLLVGTPLAMIDKARDLIRQAMQRRTQPDNAPTTSMETGTDTDTGNPPSASLQ